MYNAGNWPLYHNITTCLLIKSVDTTEYIKDSVKTLFFQEKSADIFLIFP